MTLSFFNLDQENLSAGFPTTSDTNRAVHPQKMARGCKFQIYKEVGMYYLCRENKSFVFAYAKSRFSHDAAHLLLKQLIDVINIMTKK